ncbi:MAG: response regulator [Acidobacteriota bacterium]
MATILVVDDELGIRALLSEILSDEGHTVEVAENAAKARVLREQCKPDLVLLDIWMPDVDGVTLLKEWSASGQLNMPVIMMSGHGTIDTAVEATKFGAQSFLEKPITMQKLLRAVEQGLTKPSAPRAAQVGHGHVHLATVTPITAAQSYSNLSASNMMATRSDVAVGQASSAIAYSAVANASSSHSHHAQQGPAHEQSFELDRPLREARDDFERAYFEFHLAREGGSMTRVAEKTGLERTHLYRKLKQLGVDLGRSKKAALN